MKNQPGILLVTAACLILLPLAAQETPPPTAPDATPPAAQTPVGSTEGGQKRVTVNIDVPEQTHEDIAWQKLMSEPSPSPIDHARSLEYFLDQYPNTKRRPEIERALVQQAIELNDRKRVLRFGIPVVEREPENLLIVEHVTRALLANDDGESARRALGYADDLESALHVIELQQPEGAGTQEVNFRERIDRGIGKAMVFKARATGNLGHFEEALALARSSFERFPSAEAAREAGRWLVKLGRRDEAIEAYANAFTIQDPDNYDRFRGGDRERLGKLYREAHDSEDGLGDLILAAYDRMAAVTDARHAMLKKLDPNLDASAPNEFTLSRLAGGQLDMASLLGKVVVLDFWATWCKPCQRQHPLYKQVESKYEGRDDVVFLNINADRDRKVVEPFLEEQKWDKTVYFEDGLQRLLEVSSIPTTVILDRQGEVDSKMIGFDPNRFVNMLSERIDRALNEPVQDAAPPAPGE